MNTDISSQPQEPPAARPETRIASTHSSGEQQGYFGILDALGIRGRWQSEAPELIIAEYERWYALVTTADSATGIGPLDDIYEVVIPQRRERSPLESELNSGPFPIR